MQDNQKQKITGAPAEPVMCWLDVEGQVFKTKEAAEAHKMTRRYSFSMI